MNDTVAPPATRPRLPERTVVRGGASAAVSLKAGDRLHIGDPEGLQPAELFILGRPNGAEDLPGLVRSADQPSLADRLSSPDPETATTLRSLRAAGVAGRRRSPLPRLRPRSCGGSLLLLDGARRPRCRRGGTRRRDGAGRPVARDGPHRRRRAFGALGSRPASASGRCRARPQDPGRRGPRLSGQGGRLHPDHRRRGPAMFGLPGVRRESPGGRDREGPRRHHDPHPDGARPFPAPGFIRSTTTKTCGR